MPLVQLIYRKTNPLFFSIEKVFSILTESFKKKYKVEERYMPFYNSSVGLMAKNIAFAKKGRADIYHVTGDVHYVVLGLPSKKTILTIHDSVFIRESSGAKKIFFKWLFLKLPVRNCRFVTTISEKSKEEIIAFTGCHPSKVIVIPNPVNQQIYHKEKPFNNEKPVLLFIGSTPNKNLERVAEVLKGIPCVLEIVGRIPDEHQALLQKNQIPFVQYQNLSESEMADRYANCDIVLFPSLYEGFGLPILEGQKAGRVILTSQISPMKEVAGAGACLVDPESIESIRAGLLKILVNKIYREGLISQGFENIRQYDVDQIAEQYIELYEKIMKS